MIIPESKRDEIREHIRILITSYRIDVFDRSTLSSETEEAIEHLLDTVTS